MNSVIDSVTIVHELWKPAVHAQRSLCTHVFSSIRVSGVMQAGSPHEEHGRETRTTYRMFYHVIFTNLFIKMLTNESITLRKDMRVR